jgi:hypothetical protein
MLVIVNARRSTPRVRNKICDCGPATTDHPTRDKPDHGDDRNIDNPFNNAALFAGSL